MLVLAQNISYIEANVIGDLFGFISKLFGYIMNYIYIFLDMINIPNIGLSIILFTIIAYTLMLPLTFRQQKFSKLSAVMNPEIQAVQKKYKDKKDNDSMMKMNQEMKLIYEKYGTSPTGGCLQLFIQLPIIFSLYEVIRNISDYVPALSKLGENSDKFIKVNQFLGLNLIQSPIDIIKTGISEKEFLIVIVAIMVPLLSGLSQFISTKLMPQQNTGDSDNPMASSLKTMNMVMPLMSVVFCFSVATGLGIYWITSSVVRCVQQLLINNHMNKMDIDDLIKKNYEKINKKRAKKGLPPKKVSSVAKVNTKSVEYDKIAEEKKKLSQEQIKNSSEYYSNNSEAKSGSLKSKANMVKQYNDKNKK